MIIESYNASIFKSFSINFWKVLLIDVIPLLLFKIKINIRIFTNVEYSQPKGVIKNCELSDIDKFRIVLVVNYIQNVIMGIEKQPHDTNPIVSNASVILDVFR